MLAISTPFYSFWQDIHGLALSHIGGNHVIYIKGYSR